MFQFPEPNDILMKQLPKYMKSICEKGVSEFSGLNFTCDFNALCDVRPNTQRKLINKILKVIYYHLS